MNPSVEKGSLLIASASLLDPNFIKTVVLICDHNDDEGTFGLVLNRPIPVPDEVNESLPFELDCIYQGGPVRMEAMQVIHPYGDAIPQSLRILPGIWIGGDFDVMCRRFGSAELDPSRCRFCLGYSGWGSGQLSDEFSQDAWLLTPGTPQLVFDTAADKIWSKAVRQHGRTNPLLRFFPDDPSYN